MHPQTEPQKSPVYIINGLIVSAERTGVGRPTERTA